MRQGKQGRALEGISSVRVLAWQAFRHHWVGSDEKESGRTNHFGCTVLEEVEGARAVMTPEPLGDVVCINGA